MTENKDTVIVYSRLSDFDIELFKAGKHFRLYEKLGAHLVEHEGKAGACFGVWAPNARSVSVIGDFNGWNKDSHQLFPRWDSSGIWEGFIPGVKSGEVYKYHILSNADGQSHEKGDPFAFQWEKRPKTASIIRELDYSWKDQAWMSEREHANALNRPVSVYEVHLGSWKRHQDGSNRWYSYQDLIEHLVPYVKEMGFTHVEFMPVMEHPFDGSWGYQLTGYFAPSSRYGSPQEFMALVDAFHQEGIGVLLDWVPSHFPIDGHGLYRFDGSALYEHEDPRLGFHPDWNSYIFNYGRFEVRSFLISNALFWLDRYHADGLRVDAVASMLYLDYSRNEGEWIPNQYGGRENLEAISLMKDLNQAAYGSFPNIQIIAEESTSWPGVTKPVFDGGLGFGMKWMMGWMNDTLEYFKKDPIHRKHHHNELTFSLAYVFSENFMLPLSHDEVVHGKGSLLNRMPGDEWQRFANLRLLYGWMYTHPGTKLLFMGGELAQSGEWVASQQLDWYLLQFPGHDGMQKWVRDLNHFYRSEPALFERSFTHDGFEWIDFQNHAQSVLFYLRKGNSPSDQVLIALNLTPNAYSDFRIGVPPSRRWTEVLNSDSKEYYGSGFVNEVPALVQEVAWQGKAHSIIVKLPPLGMAVFKEG